MGGGGAAYVPSKLGGEKLYATSSARFSPTATASVIARQKVAERERNEPKSLSTISNRTSASPARGESALSVITTVGTPARRARFASGLGVLDFLKRSSLVRCDAASLAALAPAALRLAQAEGLEAHALSLAIRLPRKV